MQKQIFLTTEGDAWFRRNREALGKKNWVDDDPLLAELLCIDLGPGARILEIGCGDGSRLEQLSGLRRWECHGIEPSQEAVEAARAKGVLARRGTAEQLDWDSASFDVVIFGFCLYLCDREDLFQIASEANRVLKPTGWLAIYDFFSEYPDRREYSHSPGLFSYKMDYRTLFTWHPGYECYRHRLLDHNSSKMTDDRGNWVSVSLLRKLALR